MLSQILLVMAKINNFSSTLRNCKDFYKEAVEIQLRSAEPLER